MDTPISLSTQQVDIINSSLERALSISELLVDCGPADKEDWNLLSRGSLTVVFQMVVEELSKIDEVMKTAVE